jgi:hypothetical protein
VPPSREKVFERDLEGLDLRHGDPVRGAPGAALAHDAEHAVFLVDLPAAQDRARDL